MPPVLHLPDELLQTIFAFVPDPDIFSVTLVCRRFYHLSSLPISWRDRCAQYTFWEPHHSYQRKLNHPNPSEIQWKKLFVRRYKSDKQVSELLDGIITHSTDRITRFEKIARHGYDAKDCLRRMLECGEDYKDVLARRFYASEALAFIHRRRAIEIWKKISDGVDIPLEEALGAYDLFITRGANRDVEAITRSLDCLAMEFRSQHLGWEELTHRERASAVIVFMRSVGFTGASYENYHALRNSFIGICVDSNRATLPLTTVAAFCALGTRLGLDVKPCGFTYHVVAILRSTMGMGILASNFPNAATNTTSSFASSPGPHGHVNLPHYLTPSPSNTRELIVRVARNILESVRLTGPQPTPTYTTPGSWDQPPFQPERHAALYAALTASVICGPPASTRLLEHMCTLMQRDFECDVGFFEEDMSRLISEDDTMLLHNICNAVRKEDETPKRAMRRYDQTLQRHPDPRYHIGTLFRHRRYHYEAVITGWTRSCSTSENWIRTMDVDTLKRGRHQPFYNVFVADGSSRYVAEDNIVEIRSPKGGGVLGGFLCVGKWFRRFEERNRDMGGRFVSNLKEEYPDD
ncbi:YccV-like-domain-containing protein [Terfezia boudieri ATCC MYA-4762]|uniref:YccV-like-domain-containing protein n=1 Tax=Terfezia boudieri ATCC MYA-4762 TaxID=1051890 RepID=A0A3N4LLF2_9PEZI|nr:YccV-like-domain-containing protein [Terfezia boudieri ATCC MYA-4762]